LFIFVIFEKEFASSFMKKAVRKENPWCFGVHPLIKVLAMGEEVCNCVG
jgi:hypothetical protein